MRIYICRHPSDLVVVFSNPGRGPTYMCRHVEVKIYLLANKAMHDITYRCARWPWPKCTLQKWQCVDGLKLILATPLYMQIML